MASSAYRYYAGNGNYYTYENGKMLLRDKTGHLVKGASQGNVSKVMKRDAEKKGANSHNTHNYKSNSSSSGGSSSSSSSSAGDTSSTDSTSTDTTSGSSGGSYKTTIEEVEIDNYYEALRFAYKYIHMCLRDDGHEVQLKVIGGKQWKIGEWCKIDIPSFNETGTMFITKCNTELGANDENIATLTLVDYPPSLSSGTSNTPSTGSSSGGSDTSSSTDTASTDANSSDATSSNVNTSSTSSGKTSNKSRSNSKTTRKTSKNKKLNNVQKSGTLVRSSIKANHITSSMQSAGTTSRQFRINR